MVCPKNPCKPQGSSSSSSKRSNEKLRAAGGYSCTSGRVPSPPRAAASQCLPPVFIIRPNTTTNLVDLSPCQLLRCCQRLRQRAGLALCPSEPGARSERPRAPPRTNPGSGSGGKAAVWDPRVQMAGEEDTLRTPCSSLSPPAASRDCNRRAGFYYDELLKKCINCTTICGQHPRQCAPTCESKAARKGRQSGDVGQDPPGLGWKRSQVMGPKLGKGAAKPLPFVLGGLRGCALPWDWDRGKEKQNICLSCFLCHTSPSRGAFYRPVLWLYQPGAASAAEFLTLLSCLQPLGRGSGRGRVIFPEICNSHIGVETRSLEKGEEWE